MLSKQLEQARASLVEIEETEAGFIVRAEELTEAMREADTDEEVETVGGSVEALEKEKVELEEKKAEIQEKINKVEAELKELDSKSPKNDERGVNVKDEERAGIVSYVRSKGQAREGFKVVDGGALVPHEYIPAEKAKEDIIDLSSLISVKKANRGSGSFPIIKKSGSKMISVAELEKNPELAKPTISEVEYKIETYRGYIPISQEVIDDADYDITGLIAEEIADQELETRNVAISTILKTATPKSVTGLDEFKKVFNVDIKRYYAPKAILSASLYNELDTTKDNNGRYLLQDDITVASGKKLFGNEVIVLDDEVIGSSAGDLVGFVGDAKEFATLFDRKRASVKWIDHMIYGELLAGFTRFDVVATDVDAGFYITFTPEVVA